MKSLNWLISKNGLPYTFVVFYIVGICLFIIPSTQKLFISIIPYTLILVAIAVFFYHKEWNRKTFLVLVSIFIFSILAEIIGVATGKLFGTYSYGVGLGYKLFNVPLLIGINWIILVYGSNAVLSKYSANKYLKIIGASILMVIYDFILELAAPYMLMWEFAPIRPPFENYLMWFVLAIVFNSAIELFNVNTNNKPARALFITQIFFFLIIVISTSNPGQ